VNDQPRQRRAAAALRGPTRNAQIVRTVSLSISRRETAAPREGIGTDRL
jgi:hypothetical protein